MKNTTTAYGKPARFLHWLMALIFIAMFTVGYIMTNIPNSGLRLSLFDLHKATGLLMFTLVALRLIWRQLNVQPGMPRGLPAWQHRAAQLNILVLYILMFAMPMSGFLVSTLGGHDVHFYGIFTITPLAHNEAVSDYFSWVHEMLSYLLIAAFSVHVLAALYHHYVLKDDVLKRILTNPS